MIKRFFAWWGGPRGDMVSTAEVISLYDNDGRGLRLPAGSAVNWTRKSVVCGALAADFPGSPDNIPPARLDALARTLPGCKWIDGAA